MGLGYAKRAAGAPRAAMSLLLSLVLAAGLAPVPAAAEEAPAAGAASSAESAAAADDAAADDAAATSDAAVSDDADDDADAAVSSSEGAYAVELDQTGGDDAGSVTAEQAGADAGDTVCVQALAAEGFYVAQVRWGVADEDGSGEYVFTAVAADDDGCYRFEMPAQDVCVVADFVSIVWDGAIDLTWYDPDATVLTISYAAQYAGLAAIVNGLFTTYPTSTVGTGSAAYESPDYDQFVETMGSALYGEFTATYRVSDSQDGYGRSEAVTATTRVVGDADCVVLVGSTGTTGSNNQVTTLEYWCGADDFAGKTVLIDADLDFGGVQGDDGAWDTASPLFMPVGGQYAMLPGDDSTNGYSVISASFNGTLDGQGHSFSNVYCERYANTTYGDSVSIGLVGRLGTADGDAEDLAAVDPTVRQVVLESGYFSGRRSVGGIVGKIGQTAASLGLDDSVGGIVEYCINKADVVSSDAKGAGGIVGAAWNAGLVHDCANLGSVTSTYRGNPTGGIVGSNEVAVYNCYNVGSVSAAQEGYALGIGTNNGGGDAVDNCYWLKGSAADGGYYGTCSGTVSSFDAGGLLADDLNGTGGTVWYDDAAAAGEGQNAFDGCNYPLLYFQYLDEDEADAEYTVDVEQPAQGGTVSVSASSGTYGTTVYLSCEADPGYALAYYTLDGEVLIADFFTLDGDRTVGAVFCEADSAQIELADTTDEPYELSVAKTGVAEVDGVLVSVSDWPVESGDAVYEGDVLTFTATVKEGAAPDDVDLEYNGVFNFTATAADGSSATGSRYTVTGDEGTIEVAVSFVGTQQKSWATLADTSFFDADDPQEAYEIETAEQLAGLAVLVAGGEDFAGVSFTLACDLSLENPDGTAGTRLWSPIGNEDCPFSGTFDGAGHTIADMSLGALSSCEGLFGAVCGGTVRNVAVEGELEVGASSGAVVGLACNATIEGCTNRACVSSSDRGVGGIVGVVEDDEGAAATVISACANEGTVAGASGVGGIAGTIAGASGAAPVEVTGCSNAADVGFAEGANASGGAGGIAGETENAVLEACENAGAVFGAAAGAGTAAYTGGLVGYAGAGELGITQSVNRGAVSGAAAAAGGLLGCGAYGDVDVAECYATGVVGNEEGIAGGLVGSVNNSGSTGAAISSSYAAGAVSGGTAGAVAGSVRGLATFDNVHYLGGIADAVVGSSSGVAAASALDAAAQDDEALAALAGTLGSTEAWRADALGLNAGWPMLAWELPWALTYRDAAGEALYVAWLPEGCTLDAEAVAALFGDEPTESIAGYTSTFVGWMSEQDGDEPAQVVDASGDVEAWAVFSRALWAASEDDAFAPYFTDVTNAAKYYYDPVYSLAALGYVTGLSATRYGVGQDMTREQLVTVLWRIACPDEYAAYDAQAAENESGLADVAAGRYYTGAVNWAVANGVIEGYTDGTFGVGDAMTFQQLCTVIARFACGGDAALEAQVGGDEAVSVLSAFADAGTVSASAAKGLAWCVQAGLVEGTGAGTLEPTEAVSRERGATVLFRAIAAGIL